MFDNYGYVYQAELLCKDCGERIASSLRGTHPSLCPEDDMDLGSFDSNDFPKVCDVEDESDTPKHCVQCGVFLHNALTSEGYAYIKEALDRTGMHSLGGLQKDVLAQWASWYNFRYWDAEDCENTDLVPGWYSSEAD